MRTPTLGVLMDDSPGRVVGSDRELWEQLRSADEGAPADLLHRHGDAVYTGLLDLDTLEA